MRWLFSFLGALQITEEGTPPPPPPQTNYVYHKGSLVYHNIDQVLYKED